MGGSSVRPLLVASVALALGLAACSGSQDPERRSESRSAAPLAERLAQADPGVGASLFGPCATCHTIGKNAGDRYGPGLYGVLGKPVGHASERFATTAALQALGGTWDFAKMDDWLASPKHLVPQTRMAFPGMPNGVDRADLIAYLNENGSRLPLPKAGPSGN